MSSFDSIHSLAQTVTPGTVLFEEGTAGGGIVVLLSGRLNVLKGGHMVGAITEPGSYVGESTFVTGKMRSATVVAENSATIIRLSAQQSTEFLQTPDAEAKLIRSVTQRLQSANEFIQEHAERATVLQGALRVVLTRVAEAHAEIILADSDPELIREALRKMRVAVNQYGTVDYMETPIVI
jgi:CRP-like cAMP-binding protein